MSLQDRVERAGETGEHVLAIERPLRADGRLGFVLSIDVRHAMHGVDDPHEPRARGEPVTDLAEDVAGAITGGTDLDDEVGREAGEAYWHGVWDVFAPDEGDVRTMDGVGVRGEVESRIARTCFLSSSLLTRAREHVILSAAGAKDLLFDTPKQVLTYRGALF